MTRVRRPYMTLMWWPIGKPPPRGWRETRQRPCHHNRYQRFIERRLSPGRKRG